MPTQNVNLTETLEAFVKDQVSQGFFNNASEVHRAALSKMLHIEEERQLRMEQLRREIQHGIDDANAGRTTKVSSAKGLSKMMNTSLEKALQRLERSNAEPLT